VQVRQEAQPNHKLAQQREQLIFHKDNMSKPAKTKPRFVKAVLLRKIA
jgi:hypothetical protein